MKRRIAIIDDSVSTLESTKAVILHELKDAEVVLFSDPNEAYKDIIENNGYELLVIDCIMPQMTGIGLYNTLRQNGCRTPVCFMSGSQEELDECEKLPSVQTWLKSAERARRRELCEKLDMIMNEYRNMRAIERMESSLDSLSKEMSCYHNKVMSMLERVSKRLENMETDMSRLECLSADECPNCEPPPAPSPFFGNAEKAAEVLYDSRVMRILTAAWKRLWAALVRAIGISFWLGMAYWMWKTGVLK